MTHLSRTIGIVVNGVVGRDKHPGLGVVDAICHRTAVAAISAGRDGRGGALSAAFIPPGDTHTTTHTQLYAVESSLSMI